MLHVLSPSGVPIELINPAARQFLSTTGAMNAISTGEKIKEPNAPFTFATCVRGDARSLTPDIIALLYICVLRDYASHFKGTVRMAYEAYASDIMRLLSGYEKRFAGDLLYNAKRAILFSVEVPDAGDFDVAFLSYKGNNAKLRTFINPGQIEFDHLCPDEGFGCYNNSGKNPPKYLTLKPNARGKYDDGVSGYNGVCGRYDGVEGFAAIVAKVKNVSEDGSKALLACMTGGSGPMAQADINIAVCFNLSDLEEAFNSVAKEFWQLLLSCSTGDVICYKRDFMTGSGINSYNLEREYNFLKKMYKGTVGTLMLNKEQNFISDKGVHDISFGVQTRRVIHSFMGFKANSFEDIHETPFPFTFVPMLTGENFSYRMV